MLVGALLLAAGASAAPRGRVIRVERGSIAAVPRLCAMGASRGENMCFGQPRVGERVAVVDLGERVVRGEFVIESVGDAKDLLSRGICVSTGLQMVKGTYVDGAQPGRQVMGLRGVRLSPRARVLSDVPAPSGRPEESVELALDTDGNGRADILLSQYACDVSGALSTGGEARCLDTYIDQRGTLRRVQQDILQVCS